jgi:hypothetical protein
MAAGGLAPIYEEKLCVAQKYFTRHIQYTTQAPLSGGIYQLSKYMKKYLFISLSLSISIVAILASAFAFVQPASKKTNKEYVLTEKGHRLIQRELVSPIRKKLNIKTRGEMFSRCPSGLQYNVVSNASETMAYFGVSLRNYVGCDGKKICRFRVNASQDRLEVYDEAAQEFVVAQTWLSKPVKNIENTEDVADDKIWNF